VLVVVGAAALVRVIRAAPVIVLVLRPRVVVLVGVGMLVRMAVLRPIAVRVLVAV
jgi:hypothetical protein